MLGGQAAPMGPADRVGEGRRPSPWRARVEEEGEENGDSEFPVVSGFLPNWKIKGMGFGLSFW